MQLIFTAFFVFFCSYVQAQELDQWKEKISAAFIEIESISSNQEIIAAVKESNSAHQEKNKMTNQQWRLLGRRDPFVAALLNNPTSHLLKRLCDKPYFSEAFLSNAKGEKVALLSKTTYWSHKGKEKHEIPMKGLRYTGKPELDESSGYYQVQIAVPVLVQGKPVGSLVVGLALSSL